MLGLKELETRGWKLNYRGPMAIHATKKLVPFSHVFFNLEPHLQALIMNTIEEAYGSYDAMPRGAILGTVNIKEVFKVEDIFPVIGKIEQACGDYRPGRFAWKMEDIQAFETQIQIAGHQGIWKWNPVFIGA
jgi:hypothetical protein